MEQKLNAKPRFAITGGIGSGKSYVCRMMQNIGIEVYDCDAAAKRLMRNNRCLQRRLSEAVGKDVFPNGEMDKPALAAFLLASPENNARINAIVHPAVADDFLQSGHQWMESAILYEAGFEKYVDYVVCVTAKLETRLQRIMKRDNISREKAMEWIRRQMTQEEKAQRAHFTINNDGDEPLMPQIERIIRSIGKPTVHRLAGHSPKG